jgi:hypothetical protein
VTEIENWTGSPPAGLRPPEEGADFETLRAWHAVGGSYVVGLNDGRTGSPEVHAVEDGKVVLLPRTIKDDYNLLMQERLLRPAEFSSALLEGVDKMWSLGGLALLTVHSELAGTERFMGPVGTVLDHVSAERGWWLATGSEVAEWTLARWNADLGIVRVSEDRIEVRVRAPEDRPLRGAWVELTLPEGSEGWAPESESRALAYGVCDHGLQIPIGDLAAGESRTIVVRRVLEPETPLDP